MSNTVLCVDDSATMQTVAEITFRGSDYEYTGARSADEALSAAKGASIILVDAVMPDKSGYDLAKELKGVADGAIVVMMCGNSEAYDETRGSEAGCAGHVVKPWQTDKLIEKLAEIRDGGGAAAAKPAAAKPKATGPAAMAAAAAAKPEAPRSATLMGMPALEMPPSKPLPAGVGKPAKPAVPSPKPMAAKPAAKPAAAAMRPSMIKKKPGKPIRLVLASQAESAATTAAEAGGMTSDQASALGAVSREMLEQIIWEVVPDLAEAIIKENLETLTAKAR